MTNKFKIGDRVRFTNKVERGWWFSAGQTGTIVEPPLKTRYAFDVKVDGGIRSYNAHVDAEHIELIAYVPKVGDWVKGFGILSGIPKHGTIRRICGDSIELTSGTHLRKTDIELYAAPVPVPEPAGSFIVVNVKNGKLACAASPHIHTTRELAEKEALRLAELIRGQDFRVYSFDHLSTANAAPVVSPAAKLTNASAL